MVSEEVKVGDSVFFSYLLVPGSPGKAQWGRKEGIVTKIKLAGNDGAKAIGCAPEDSVYFIKYEGIKYPKLRCELQKMLRRSK